jgi:hypothetical protein
VPDSPVKARPADIVAFVDFDVISKYLILSLYHSLTLSLSPYLTLSLFPSLFERYRSSLCTACLGSKGEEFAGYGVLGVGLRGRRCCTAACLCLTPRYRGTSLIRNSAPLGPYSRTKHRALWWPGGGRSFL